MDRVEMSAPAKVNLFLRVSGVRDDGYHEIESVMQTVSIFDRLVMERVPVTRVSFDTAALAPEPPDLIEKAIGVFNETVGGTQGAEVRVDKQIPIGAGLGGGSSDAAAALMGIDRMMGGLTPPKLLSEIASQVGSDVPFFLNGGTALVSGRGEIVKSLPSLEAWWVIGVPDLSMSTEEVYAAFDRFGSSQGPSLQEFLDALSTGEVAEVGGLLHNDLEVAAFDLQPELRDLKEEMHGAGALGAVMTGSGSAIVGLCRDEEHANAVSKTVSQDFERVIPARSISGSGKFE
ncbi:MAG: 4-(cytidine 5'-diphospho)-2-C-methyl-D-erythritol kinase [Actinobacteria bacterium]|nr:4-(cytidine 5'-diphospho)-2-C-methyl-D-erythritol kinase [Actinomycetota bacterium]